MAIIKGRGDFSALVENVEAAKYRDAEPLLCTRPVNSTDMA